MDKKYKIMSDLEPNNEVLQSVDKFLTKFTPLEVANQIPLLLNFDKKSSAYYLICHLNGQVLSEFSDLEATIDNGDEDELYKLNRDITEDESAFIQMESDAKGGRSFEDIVLEFDLSYRENKPLKVYGGQHRIKAISKSLDVESSIPHGIRIYFCLSKEQKVEIAIVNNTSIAVPNDLLDRMQEQLLGSELRTWCQKVGLLENGQDFSDKRNPSIPTVRIARTLILNYYKGRQSKSIEDFHQPIVCRSGGIDTEYEEIRSRINWDDPDLEKMGKEFARLHKIQSETVKNRETDNYAEYQRKAFSYAVVAGWSYAAGLFQRDKNVLDILYTIPNLVDPPDDPLNAKDLSEARLKGVDSDTYRGLGTRYSQNELGRVLELFIVMATKSKKRVINKELANAAIQSYEAKKATEKAEEALGKI